MNVKEYIEAHSIPVPEAGCRLWLLHREGRGYGRGCFNGSRIAVHRAAYEAYVGPIPEGMHVLHKCDTMLCCEPSHLFLGTNKRNVEDRVSKGRSAWGERHGRAKLTAEQVLAIRADERKHAVISRAYGIAPKTVRQIKARERWKSLDAP